MQIQHYFLQGFVEDNDPNPTILGEESLCCIGSFQELLLSHEKKQNLTRSSIVQISFVKWSSSRVQALTRVHMSSLYRLSWDTLERMAMRRYVCAFVLLSQPAGEEAKQTIIQRHGVSFLKNKLSAQGTDNLCSESTSEFTTPPPPCTPATSQLLFWFGRGLGNSFESCWVKSPKTAVLNLFEDEDPLLTPILKNVNPHVQRL